MITVNNANEKLKGLYNAEANTYKYGEATNILKSLFPEDINKDRLMIRSGITVTGTYIFAYKYGRGKNDWYSCLVVNGCDTKNPEIGFYGKKDLEKTIEDLRAFIKNLEEKKLAKKASLA